MELNYRDKDWCDMKYDEENTFIKPDYNESLFIWNVLFTDM